MAKYFLYIFYIFDILNTDLILSKIPIDFPQEY